jgi:hypothetical protein
VFLRRGLNVLAVEVHQSTANDPDLFWDAELTYRVGGGGEPLPVRIIEFRFDPGGFLLRWDSVPGETYRVQHSDDLVLWADTSSSITAAGAVTEFTDSAASAARFYRVISE